MTLKISDFVNEVAYVSMQYRGYPTKVAELNAIATALGSDTTQHDKTIEAAPVQGLQVGHYLNTPYTNRLLLFAVNKGKAGGLTPAAMASAITSNMALFQLPVNTAAPAVTGTGSVGNTLTCTPGTWSNSPTYYTYQWLRGGAYIPGATAPTYVLQTADSGSSIVCRVWANNSVGYAPANSNATACA